MLLALPARADEARAAIDDSCLSCHGEELLKQQRLQPKQWAAVVKKMQGWGAQVEPERVDAVVAHLAARYGTGAGEFVAAPIDAARADALLAPLPDGKWAGGAPAKGKSLYRTACASCHGDDAHGTDKGMNLADRPALWRAPELAQVVRKGRARMPGFPFNRAQIADLIAYLRSLD